MSRPRGLGVAAAIFYIALWASAYVPSKIGVLNSSPLWFLAVRFTVSGLIALAIARATGAKWPANPRAWVAVFVLGVLANGVYLGFTYEALRHLAAGVGAIVASTNPLLLAIVAPYLLRERLTFWKIVGLLLGFGGVVAIMIARNGTGTAEPRDVLLAFIGVVGSVAGTIVFKRFCGGIDLRMTTALQLLAAAIVVLPGALLSEGAPHAHWGVPIVASFIYVVLVMSIGAALLWLWLLHEGEASRVSAFYFLTPVFGLIIASFFGEPMTVRDLGGLIAIAIGIAIVQRA